MLPLTHLAFSVELKIFRCLGLLHEASALTNLNLMSKKRNSAEIKSACYFRAPPNLVIWVLFSEVEDLILVAP